MNSKHIQVSETRYGRLNHFDFDDPIGVSLTEYGEWAQAEIDLLAGFVSFGDTVVDVGANIGTHTVAFAQMVGPTGQVIAIEPQPTICELLKRNVEDNGLRTVTVHAYAVSDRRGSQRLAIPDYGRRHNSGMASLTASQGSSVDVPTRCLDELALPKVALLKLDVEGWEYQALVGAVETIRRARPTVYAECNSIELGWKLFGLLAPDYEVFLHAPPAFNPKNFRRSTSNLFGLAQETNLLFVPKTKPELIERMREPNQWVSRVTSLDDLCGAFVRANRFGEKEVPAERTHELTRRLRYTERQLLELRRQPVGAVSGGDVAPRPPVKKLTRPVKVIVPIYNGFDDFKMLVDSIVQSHPQPVPELEFVFINDASPDQRIMEYLGTPHFSRPDVQVLHNPRNLGFIGTVNRGIGLASKSADGGCDVVILNTDTQIHGNVLAIMQDVAYRLPSVASVTPLTNNGTIASLWNWPNGGELFGDLKPAVLAKVVEEARVQTPLVDVPTGIGFCMYMTKAALAAVGGFDPIFGKGYGEENNWCQTASKKGFVNLITTEAFVYHHGSQSFGDELKQLQLQTNLSILEKMHPNYHADIQAHLDADPIRDARIEVLWSLRQGYKRALGLHTVLYVVHSDPGYFGGGTERHVMSLTAQMLSEGKCEVFHLYPDHAARQWVFKAYFPSEPSDGQMNEFIVARFDEESLPQLLEAVASEVDTLHVHHFMGWPRWFLRSMEIFEHSRRLLTLHDYYAACPSIRLIGAEGYCRVPSNMSACNKCLATEHGYKLESIEEYRSATAHFLRQFHEVFTPSEAARQVLLRAFQVVSLPGGGTLADALLERIRVAPNFLLEAPSAFEAPSAEELAQAHRPRIAFLGAFAPPKGSMIFQAAVPALLKKGYLVEVWGALGHKLMEGVSHRPYSTMDELRELAQDYPVDLVVMPAIWPETFSFTTFEGALEVGAPLVVGPFGNPPELVRRHGIGVVVDELTPHALLEAIERALSIRPQLLERLEAFSFVAKRYDIDSYFNLVYPKLDGPTREAPPAGARRLPLSTLVNRRAPRAPSQGPLPLRYRMLEDANELVKLRVPALHTVGKRVASWLSNRD